MDPNELLIKIQTKTGSIREKEITDFIDTNELSKIIPPYLNEFTEVKVEHEGNKLQYYVSKDYFCIGEDNNNFILPVFPLTIKPWLEKLNCSLPTPKMVEQIYRQATYKIPAFPQTTKKGESITSTKLYVGINDNIKSFRLKNNIPTNAFVAGHKKDVVLTNILAQQKYKGNIAIYGWYYSNGARIQGLNAKDHTIFYVDYSHGFRLISNRCLLNSTETTLQTIWNHPKLCLLLHDEPLKFQSY